ncbi:MAG: hypothetical protein NUW22_13250 [Acidobacteria bacterium]|nr:hypothetical protein [Acidobacteriota bacterium]
MANWTPARRQRASERAKARWERTTPAVREEWQERSRDAFAEKYPERVALSERTRAAIASGELVPEACDECGGEGQPLYDWVELVVVGWRCYPCRKPVA